jgi:sugar/nucleoside kinase (ribokinase family)
VAVGLARFGFKSAILTAIGDDYYGEEILNVYKKEKVGDEFVKINKGKETNYHFVLNFKAERTILIKHQEYDYYDISKIDDVPWIYFSSMGENTQSFHKKFENYLNRHPKIKMGFNPGTFQLKMGRKQLKDTYKNTFVLFVNREEAQKILGIKNPSIKPLLNGLHDLGPEIVVITDGPAGSYASNKIAKYFMPKYPDPKPPFSRTGAGDAFGSGLMAALMYGLPLHEALRWAPINSMSVVQQTGARAGLLTKPKLLAYLKKAPKSYKPRKI